ncbi:MAG: hypothetical protein LBI95_04315 [Holosporales bacterium]|jgi:hypothetical protein|nr:hypothetical protein [Holosporales bacterium]
MNVICPYCKCCYEIDDKVLKNPIGNKKLGYGWWVRCYRCNRKWWIRHSFAEETVNAPPIANNQIKIDKLSAFIKKREKQKPHRSRKILGYLMISIILASAALGYLHRNVFYSYLISKARKLSKSIASKIIMTDVRYKLENDLITVFGNVFNEDKSVVKINGVKIMVIDEGVEVISWNEEFDSTSLLPQQKIPFLSTKQLPSSAKSIRVEVSIF